MTAGKQVDAEEIAARAAAAMERGDEAVRSAGVRLLAVGPGWARTAMTVDRRHRGGHGLCHGGVPVAEFRGRTRVVPGLPV